MSNLFMAKGGSVAVHKAGFVFNMGIKAPTSTNGVEAMPSTTPYDKPEYLQEKIVMWGDSNDFPQVLHEECKKNTIIPSVLDFASRIIQGQGITYYKRIGRDKNGDIKEYPILPEIEDFFNRSSINSRYLDEAALDLVWFYNVFPELGTSVDGSKIVRLTSLEAMECRWEIMNKSTRLVENCYVSKKWPNPEKSELEVVPVIDPYDPFRVENLQESKPGNYIYPLSMSSPGKTYYQEPPWLSVRYSGWLKFVQSIPQYKAAIMENQINIKYHVRIPIEFWEWKRPGFEGLNDIEKENIISGVIDEFIESFSGTDKSGKVVTTHYWSGEGQGEYGKWDIEVLKSDFGDGTYIEDSQEGSSHLLFALNIDQTLIGNSPGKGLAGSGSDKRVSFNITDAMMAPRRKKLLEPLYFIRDYNGWGEDIFFEIKGHQIMTLDTGKEKIEVTNEPTK